MSNGEQVMAGFWELFNKRIWLDSYRMKERLAGYKPSEIHCIEHIGKHGDSNVTRLAEAFSMTRSAISKLTRKLVQKGLIQSYQKPDNKKEIYFSLTGHGQEIYNIHEKLHREYQERDHAVLQQVTDEQLHSILGFIEAYREHLDAEIAKVGAQMESIDFDRL